MEGQKCIRQSFGWRCCGINRFLSLIALYSNNSVPDFFCNSTEHNFANKPLRTNMKNRARLALLSLISSSQSFYSIGLIQKKKKLISNPQSRQQDLFDAKVGTSQSVLLNRHGLLELLHPHYAQTWSSLSPLFSLLHSNTHFCELVHLPTGKGWMWQ